MNMQLQEMAHIAMQMNTHLKMQMTMKTSMQSMMVALHYASWLARASTPMHLYALPVHALRQVIIQILAFLCMIVNLGCLITRKNAGIVPLAIYESQVGGLNHTYFTYDRDIGPARVADGGAFITRVLCMLVHFVLAARCVLVCI